MNEHGVIITGPQKAGTHLLWKAVQLFGFIPYGEYWHRDKDFGEVVNGVAIHTHLIYDKKNLVSNAKFAVILRDPRDIIVARARTIYQSMPVKDAIMENLKSGALWKLNPELMLGWAGWMVDPDACVIYYEDLIETPDAVITALGNYFNAEPKGELTDGTATWLINEVPWAEVWDKEIDKQFIERGGYDVVKAFGYAA